MAEETAQDSRGAKPTAKRFWLAAITGVVVGVVALIYLSRSHPSVDERLAAIEATWAIPDSQNAAILYDKLLQNPNALVNDQPAFLDPNSVTLTRSQPWTGNDYPKLAVWLKEHQWLIDELMKISQFEKCQFPLIVEPNGSIPLKRLRAMRKWRFLLCWAANNDVGEDRIDDAIAKWQCMIQIGKHLRQQSQLIEYIEGTAIEAVTMHLATGLLAEGNISDRDLRKIESFEVRTQDEWTAVLDRVSPVDKLLQKKFEKQMSLINRLKYEFNLRQFKGGKDTYQIAHGVYLRTLVFHRGMYIMVALRRYKDENGHWPQTLDEIEPRVVEEILIDPQNSGSYVYRLTQDGFRLYSRGPNGKDEEGRHEPDGPDDLSIWPRQQAKNG